MRFLFAGIAFLASLLLAGLGAWQIVQARAADHETFAVQQNSEASLIVVPGEVLVDHGVAATIAVTAEGPITAVVGRQSDVTGWVGESAHEVVSLDREEKTLQWALVGAGADAPSPAGGDLWTAEYAGEQVVEFQTEASSGLAVLIATEQGQPVQSLSLTWPLDGRAPWSGPLLVAGAVLLLVALGLLLWAIIGHRRDAAARRRVSFDEGPVSLRPSTSPIQLDEASAGVLPAEAQAAPDTGQIALPAEPDTGQIPLPPSQPSPWQPPAGGWAAPSEPVSLPQRVAHPEPLGVVETSVDSESLAVAAGVQAPEAQVDRTDDSGRDDERRAGDGTDGDRQTGDPQDGDDADDERQDGDGTDAERQAEDRQREEHPGDDAPPRPPAPPASQPGAEEQWKRPRGRDRSSAPKRAFRLAAVLTVGTLGLAGCSAELWPEAIGGAAAPVTPTAISSIEQALVEEGAAPPVVTAGQLDRILDAAAETALAADQARDATALAGRFEGAALSHRQAVYQAQNADASTPAPTAFPTGEVVYALPEASTTWPRTVFAVVEPGDGQSGASPFGVVLVQNTAREPYRVASLTQLLASVTLPAAAPIEIGATGLSQVAAKLLVAPEQLAAAYGDVVLAGDGSASAALFDAELDTFRLQIGQEYRDAQLAGIDQTASELVFSNRAGTEAPLGVSTLDGGAIVAVSLQEVERLAATSQLATIGVTGRAAALAGTTQSPYGFEKIYTDQLLFAVPPASAGGQVRLLGYAQALTEVRQLEQNEVTIG